MLFSYLKKEQYFANEFQNLRATLKSFLIVQTCQHAMMLELQRRNYVNYLNRYLDPAAEAFALDKSNHSLGKMVLESSN